MDRFHLYNDLYEVLKTNERFCTDDGKLNKAVIEQAATSLDGELLSMLLSIENLKKHFFKEVNGMMVFDKVDFLKFIINKNLLHDDYSFYKERIGLTNEHGQYIADSQEVVLSWKYKDCMLEGGQTKEEAKRDEVFWNEILASDEINRLTEAKAFANFKRYDKDGEHEVEHLMPIDNLIIKGNNLLALYSLREKYAGKVKLIYIDPPYFFRKNISTDTFKYNSNFRLSTWLTFMRDRLECAKVLLKTGGTIWIHMGDDGMHYLKMVADQVFGSDHFVGTLPRRTRSGKSDVPFNFSQDFDWILVYTNVNEDVYTMGRGVERKYYVSDDFPGQPWRTSDLTKQTTAKERPNSFFTMVDPKTGKKYPASEKRTWCITEDTFEEYYKKGYIIFPDDYDFLNISKPYGRKFKWEDDEKGKLSSVISDLQIQDFLKALTFDCKNEKGNDEIDALFGRDEFDYAKPENLIKSIIEVATSEGDLVMDFFSGSGTTAAVAHKMNRQYIACEQIDHQIELNLSRIKKVIEGEQGGVSQSVNWKGGGSFVYCELAKANEIYREEIFNAKEEAELNTIWESMQATNFLSYKIDPTKIDVTSADYTKLTLEEKKRFLMECLDMNQLYIPFADMDNPDYEISAKDKELTREFYGVNENE